MFVLPQFLLTFWSETIPLIQLPRGKHLASNDPKSDAFSVLASPISVWLCCTRVFPPRPLGQARDSSERLCIFAASGKLFLLIFLQFLHFAYQSRQLALHPHVLHRMSRKDVPLPLCLLHHHYSVCHPCSWVSLKRLITAAIAAEFTVLCLCRLEAF